MVTWNLQIVEITSWQALEDAIQEFCKAQHRGIQTPLYRGQENSAWPLQSTLGRLIKGRDSSTAIQIESAALSRFKRQAHLHLPAQLFPKDNSDPFSELFGWWSLMRHHYAPTRLLDWSVSPYVASYFACQTCVEHDASTGQVRETDGAMWMVEPRWVSDRARNLYGPSFELDRPDKPAEGWILFRPPTIMSDRMVAQKGWFSFCGTTHADQADLICDILTRTSETAASCNGPFFKKLVIRAAQKLEFLNRLWYMNISANSLFPGPDGLGLSIKDSVRLGHTRDD